MKKLLAKVKEYIQTEYWFYEYKIKDYLYEKRYKKLYDDWNNDEYNCGSMKHIWGCTGSDYEGKYSNFYTMNDIDITYDRESKKYYLGVETIYLFENKEDECSYLKSLLKAFSEFMDHNNYSKEPTYSIFCRSPKITNEVDTIEELFYDFKIFVEGYCKVNEFYEEGFK